MLKNWQNLIVSDDTAPGTYMFFAQVVEPTGWLFVREAVDGDKDCDVPVELPAILCVKCNHTWTSARSVFVKAAAWCPKCGAVRQF